MSKIISIQGNVGSFSHIAAEHLFGPDIELLERDTFKEVFEDLKSDRATEIVIPIENSTYGSIYKNFDLLSEYDFHIIKEVYLVINFHLIALPNIKLENIKYIRTHPVALDQIRNFLEQNNSIVAEEFPDTAGALKMIKELNQTDSAGAASKKAAEIYGMEVIKEKIQHNKNNNTRFFALSKNNKDQKYSRINKYKTTLQFELGEEPGSLYKALGFFNDRNIALSKIESRPIINTHWNYRFYLDFQEGMNEPMKEAINELKTLVKDFRILGSYKRGEYIET